MQSVRAKVDNSVTPCPIAANGDHGSDGRHGWLGDEPAWFQDQAADPKLTQPVSVASEHLGYTVQIRNLLVPRANRQSNCLQSLE